MCFSHSGEGMGGPWHLDEDHNNEGFDHKDPCSRDVGVVYRDSNLRIYIKEMWQPIKIIRETL